MLAMISIMAVSVPASFAQCARGVVSVRGKIENLPPGNADILVLLKTPKGNFSKTSNVADGQFQIDVDFSTLKSWSPLLGHHCSNKPKVVEITLKQASRMLVQKSLNFAHEFESQDSLSYNLKRELTLDAKNPTSTKP